MEGFSYIGNTISHYEVIEKPGGGKYVYVRKTMEGEFVSLVAAFL